jgi:hypothetical protein
MIAPGVKTDGPVVPEDSEKFLSREEMVRDMGFFPYVLVLTHQNPTHRLLRLTARE